MVCQRVRDKIANLKLGEVGYKTAWDRPKKECRQTKLVVNSPVKEIVNMPVVKGCNNTKIREFHEALSRNHDALLTLEHGSSY